MSALDAQVGIADETVFGTAVVPTLFPEFNSENVTATYARVESDGLRAGRRYRSDSRFTTYIEGAAGDLEMEVTSKGFGKFLKHMLGAVSSSAVVDGATTHTFTPGNLDSKSFTLQIGRPFYEDDVVQAFTYPGCKIASWELANSNDGNLIATLTLDAQTEDTVQALAVAAYATGVETFSWVGGKVTIANVDFDVTEASVTGDNALKTDRRYLRRNPLKKKQTRDGYASGEFSLTADFDSLAQRARVASATAAGAMATIVLSWRGKTLIGATTFPEITVTINARFDAFEANVGGPEGIMQALSGVYLGTSAISIAYVTTDLAAAV